MDRCLKAPELLSNIFYHLAEPGPVDIFPEHALFPTISPENATFFAGLARTCKAFSEPALDRLWHSQANFTPLLKTLPPGVVHEDKNGILTLTRRLHARDYDRVAYYAKRVRVFGLPLVVCLGAVDEHILLHFWANRPNASPLLPRLFYLRFDLQDCIGLCLDLQMVIGPSVQAITLFVAEDINKDDRVSDGQLPWKNVAALLSQGAPNLKVFDIETHSEYEPLCFGSPPAILDLYNTFYHLQSLDARSIQLPSTTLTRLGALPKLYSVTISITDREFAHFLTTTSSIKEFSSLKSISLEVEDLTRCSAFFHRQGLSKLESITITRVQCTHSRWNLDSFFEELAKQETRFSSLTAVHLTSPAADLPQGIPYRAADVSVLTPATLKPLFTFTNMECLYIGLNSRVDLDNDFIASIPQAWPKLHMLGLVDNGRDEGVDPKNTLAGLLPLVTSCPYLEELLISVDAQPSLSFSEIGTIVGARNLSDLGLGTSPISDLHGTEIPLFLSMAFPCIQQLAWDSSYIDPIMEKRWKAVCDSLEPTLTLQ